MIQPGEIRVSRYRQPPASANRRAHLRFTVRVPAVLRLRVGRGERLREEADVENIGLGGFRVRLGRRLEPGATVFALLRFTASATVWGGGPLVAVRGPVLRCEPGADGGWVAAVAITRHRFL